MHIALLQHTFLLECNIVLVLLLTFNYLWNKAHIAMVRLQGCWIQNVDLSMLADSKVKLTTCIQIQQQLGDVDFP